jgi:hypothetical protein
MRTEQMQSSALVGRARARKKNIATVTVNETPIARATKIDTQTGGTSEIATTTVTMTTSVRKIALVRRTRIRSVQDETARRKTKNNATTSTRNTAPRVEAAKTVIATGIGTTTKNRRVLLPHAPFPRPSMHPQVHQQMDSRSAASASRKKRLSPWRRRHRLAHVHSSLRRDLLLIGGIQEIIGGSLVILLCLRPRRLRQRRRCRIIMRLNGRRTLGNGIGWIAIKSSPAFNIAQRPAPARFPYLRPLHPQHSLPRIPNPHPPNDQGTPTNPPQQKLKGFLPARVANVGNQTSALATWLSYSPQDSGNTLQAGRGGEVA